MTQRTCAKAPCKSCPYRTDAPSGVWDSSEYEKLPHYDGTMVQQIEQGGTGVFLCHQQDGQLCAGWVGAHGPHNLVALRLNARHVHRSVWDYHSPVPLFASGHEAAEHGMRDIEQPSVQAERVINRLVRTKDVKFKDSQ